MHTNIDLILHVSHSTYIHVHILYNRLFVVVLGIFIALICE